jgi:hypothetical protein
MGDNDYIDSVLNANRDLNWVKRLYEVNPQSIQIPGQTGRSTHFLESADSRVYPTVVQLPDGSLKYLGPDAYDYADSTNSYIQFPTDKKAQWFAKNYKQGKDVLKGFESEKQQQTKGKKSMPNNPKKKAGESGKAAADMMSALSDYYLTAQRMQDMMPDNMAMSPAFDPLTAQPQQAPGYAGLMGQEPTYFIPGGMNYPMTQAGMERIEADPHYAERYANAARAYSEPWNAGAMLQAGIPQRIATGATERPRFVNDTPFTRPDGSLGSGFAIDYWDELAALPYGFYTPVVDQLGNRSEYSPDAWFYQGYRMPFDPSRKQLDWVRKEILKDKAEAERWDDPEYYKKMTGKK